MVHMAVFSSKLCYFLKMKSIHFHILFVLAVGKGKRELRVLGERLITVCFERGFLVDY